MSSNPDKVRVAVIGCGHWGPNHARVFAQNGRSVVTMCVDADKRRLAQIAERMPDIRTSTSFDDALESPDIDAVVIATPTALHAEMTARAVKAGKHVLVEKPLCKNVEEARMLCQLADTTDRVIMVGHVFLFNSGILKLRELIQNGDVGRVHYLDAARTNLGPIRGDVNALYDLGAHDVSVFNFLLGDTPVEVSATGRCITQPDVEDVCFATFGYADGTAGHLHVSWLNPRKIRTMTVIGEKQMAHWDDVDPFDTLRVFDKGVAEPPHYDSFGQFKYLLRNADVHLPLVKQTEPLVNQANAFLDSVIDGAPCCSGVREGAAIVAALQAANESIAAGGQPQEVAILDDVACFVGA